MPRTRAAHRREPRRETPEQTETPESSEQTDTTNQTDNSNHSPSSSGQSEQEENHSPSSSSSLEDSNDPTFQNTLLHVYDLQCRVEVLTTRRAVIDSFSAAVHRKKYTEADGAETDIEGEVMDGHLVKGVLAERAVADASFVGFDERGEGGDFGERMKRGGAKTMKRLLRCPPQTRGGGGRYLRIDEAEWEEGDEESTDDDENSEEVEGGEDDDDDDDDLEEDVPDLVKTSLNNSTTSFERGQPRRFTERATTAEQSNSTSGSEYGSDTILVKLPGEKSPSRRKDGRKDEREIEDEDENCWDSVQ
jgi:hypothetical protein